MPDLPIPAHRWTARGGQAGVVLLLGVLVLLVDVYHELAEPEKTMQHVRQALKRDGRVVIIEYRKEDPSIPITTVRLTIHGRAATDCSSMA